jgi:hypothetical protein
MAKTTLIAFAISAAFALVNPALAGGGHSHDGKHGGKVVETGHHHIEVVAKDGLIQVYLEHEDGKAEDVAGAKATATVLSGGKKEDVALTPDPANFLKGTGSFTAEKGTTIVITLTMPGHKPEQARVKLD